jgi:Dual specificity phosphatase, catalytic domain
MNHIRYTSKISQQLSKDLIKQSSIDKNYLDLILSKWKTLPTEDQEDYSGLKFLYKNTKDDESFENFKPPKENIDSQPTKPTSRAYSRSKTTPFARLSNQIEQKKTLKFMSEILYKDYFNNEEVFYKLFLSDLDSASDLGLLQKNKIYAILSVGTFNTPMKFASIKGGYLCVDLDSDGDLAGVMDSVYRFIDTYMRRGNVLVHCNDKNSISCAAVVGFIMKKFKSDYKNACEVLKKSEINCKITSHFKNQLKRMERQLLMPE